LLVRGDAGRLLFSRRAVSACCYRTFSAYYLLPPSSPRNLYTSGFAANPIGTYG
jgi:hypothetical protein